MRRGPHRRCHVLSALLRTAFSVSAFRRELHTSIRELSRTNLSNLYVAGAPALWPSPLELPIRSDVVGTLPSGILDLKVSPQTNCADRVR